ncbi:uncharacterized protein LOC125681516 [Ostrea edulis]|uniref:uncharacterized protein LOC125681516 n=1 Tax=Ostrea edulis TaxID=37623 RepID=UPI0024AFA196|nr:uncharacterized protein LOC125681516 [Ostrea edulis]
MMRNTPVKFVVWLESASKKRLLRTQQRRREDVSSTTLKSEKSRVLHTLFEEGMASLYLDFSTPEYRLNSMIMDVAYHRLYKPARTMDDIPSKSCRQFLKLKFTNKGIDAVNISNILRHKKVQSCIPNYFKFKSTLCISYSYTSTIASKLFNYKQTLQCLDIDPLIRNPPTCSCSSSSFNYSPVGHAITGEVDIVKNKDLKSLILKGPKYREPQSFNWRQNFISIMSSVKDYARRWAKYEKEELDTLSEWVKSIRGILKSRIRHMKTKVRTIYPSVFSKPEVIKELDRLHEEYVLLPAEKASNNIVFVCKAHH